VCCVLTQVVCVCVCCVLTGCVCDDVGGGCEQHPCQHGGVCESVGEGFRCICSPHSDDDDDDGRLYGGETCSVPLTACDGPQPQCENHGTCSPSFQDQRHTFTCLCPQGFTGPRCHTSTIFSFRSRGHVALETHNKDPNVPLSISFSFRTSRPSGTLLQHQVDQLLLTVQLKDGHLRLLSLRGPESRTTLVQELPEFLSDSSWHRVEVSLGGVVSLVRLLDLCSSQGNCTRTQTSSTSEVLQSPGSGSTSGSGSPPQTMILGAPGAEDQDQHQELDQDQDQDPCKESPCRTRGSCISLDWRSYRCECYRPYEGHDCGEGETHTHTHTHTHVTLNRKSAAGGHRRPSDNHVIISMFIRSKHPSGLLLIMANSTSHYLRVWLDQGRVKVQINHFETLVGGASVDDGGFHLVTLKLEGGVAALLQSAQTQAVVPIRPVRTHPGDLVSVGGLEDPEATGSLGGYFRGCIQDLRINSRRLQFFPISTEVDSYRLERMVNVSEGCSSEDGDPCVNGGVCYSMWEDFLCACPSSTAGRRCEEVQWCNLGPCPHDAQCQPQPQGFQCLSNVTFALESSVLRYRSNRRINRSLSSIFLSFRTRRPDATLLHAHTNTSSLTVSLHSSRLLLELQDKSSEVKVQSQALLSDGLWNSVRLRLEEEHAPNSRWIMDVNGDTEEINMSDAATGSLNFLQEGADVFLGGRGLDDFANFSGCLGPVEVGGLLLPFHLDTEFKLPRPQEELFSLTGHPGVGSGPRRGCWGSSVCEPNPCLHQGACDDLFDLHQCTCPPEWAGPLCAHPADPCTPSPCVYGMCISNNTHAGFQCVCEPGYGGERCEAEVNACENNESCLCPHNRTGPRCHFPQLPQTHCVGTRWNYSCFNGGNCSNAESCDCLPGFTGQWCEKDVDECASDPCMHGGFCVNYINAFECVCDINYSGIHCQKDVSDFYLYLFLGLWQNLFQLVSYLVLRMDDEPEVEWDFYLND
uniref:Uncharacterized protein n=1 Tax=Gouania willdenowi TaxID=441366 RepID=A0A8C5N118_GOUWI